MKKLLYWICLCFFYNSGFGQINEANFLKTVHVYRNQGFDATFNTLSKTSYPMTLAIPATILGVGLLKKDKSISNKGIEMFATVTVAMGTTTVLKYTIQRPRPVEKWAFIMPTVNETDPAFPSGHTTAAFATATNLTLAYPKWYVYVPAYTWAAGVGYARLHQGVHYPSDVLVGAVIGIGSALLTHRLNKWIHKR